MKWKRTGCLLLAVAVWVTGIQASATSIKSIQNQKSQNERELKNIQSQISGLEGKKNALNSEVNSLNDELVETMLNIEVLESDLEAKEEEIRQAEIDYEEAKETEERQYEAMKLRIQYLYESGSSGYMEMLLTSNSMADLMNKVDYAEELQEYDNRLLDEYKAAKQAVIDLQNRLAEEKEELLEMEAQLEEQKDNLEAVIARKRSEIADFDSQLSAARAKVSQYQQKIKEQNAQIKKLQEEAAKAAAAAAAAKAAKNSKDNSSGSSGSDGGDSDSSGNASSSGGSSSGSSSSSGGSSGGSSSSGGSGLGSSIASYGQQFIGCPYVFGGNSLTNGVDCSGFVQQVFKNFGISTPRVADDQMKYRYATVVDISSIQPGDLLFYGAGNYASHVAIYMGDGKIVHASNSQPYPKGGIKVSNYDYQTPIRAVRYWS